MDSIPPAVTAALLVAGLSGLTSPAPQRALDARRSPGQVQSEFIKLMNVGKAYLENRNSGKAIETFEAAVKLVPNSAAGLRNLARSHYLARNFDAALEALTRVRAIDPDSVATSYLTGLAQARASRFEQARAHLERAVRLDPHTATLRYQLASVQQATGQHEKAVEQLSETVRLDPLHASAHYRLGSYARMAGDKEEFLRRNREFVRLRKLFGEAARSPQVLETCLYTKPEPPRIVSARPATFSDPARIDVKFTDVTADAFGSDADRAATVAAVIDVEADGRCSFFVVDPKGEPVLLSLSPEGKFSRRPIESDLPRDAGFGRCLIGDFHDDVPQGTRYDPKKHIRNDVLLLGQQGPCLLKRTAAAKFEDVTERAGLSDNGAHAAQWVDYEHDGDLDLLVAARGPLTAGGVKGALQLLQNNGDGTFSNVTAAAGIADTGSVMGIAAADLNGDLAVDFVVLRDHHPTLVFENQRLGRFARQAEPPGPWPAADQVLVDDLNNDGHVDVVLFAASEAIVLLGQSGERRRIDLDGLAPGPTVLLDFDNDGWLDLLLAGSTAGEAQRGVLRLWRNLGGERWLDVTSTSGLASLEFPPVVDIVMGDVDADGDTDVLLLDSSHRLTFLRNDGGDKNGQLKIRLVPTKTNPSGYGTHVEVRAADFWVTRSVARFPVEIGLGGRSHLDSVQTVWTNGVVDNQIGIDAAGQPLDIVELNVAAGSCPFLYAWAGEGYRFVTDMLGNAPLGLPLTRDAFLPSDPDEIVTIGKATTFPPRNGAYTIEITSEFREVLYLDHVKLLSVDHPPDFEIHPTDKLMPPPFPESRVQALGARKPLLAAENGDGVDYTEELRAIDGTYVLPGLPLPSPYRGMCYPASLTLDFGPIDPTLPLVLALTGWLQYGDASANIAMSQNSALTIMPPRLEAETGTGAWIPLDVTVGMPAGKTKTILCDLGGKLPAGVRRLRLTTTFEIRWDRIALFEHRPLKSGQPIEILPRAAHLYQRGFSEIKSRAPGHPTTPEYDAVRDRPPWRTTPQGWCTRYGDVLELLARRDNALVILNAGDALTVEFDANAGALGPPKDGLQRTFLLYSVGWDKDADHNILTGQTVEPLPFDNNVSRGTDDADFDWRVRYNTRWVPRERFSLEN